MTSPTTPNERQKAGRRNFLIINALFFGPLAIAVFIYFTGGWRPMGSTEVGELLWPPVTIPNIVIQEATDTQPRKQLRGIWTMIYAGPGDCAEPCATRLDRAAQMRLTFGKDAKRIQVVFLADSEPVDVDDLVAKQPALQVLSPEQSADALVVIGDYQPGELYLVDPQGNIILKYAGDIAIEDVRKDVKKLLKLSQIG